MITFQPKTTFASTDNAAVKLTAMAGDKVLTKQSGESRITRYAFTKPIKLYFGTVKEAEIVANKNYEILNAYTDNGTISCIRSKDGKVFVKHYNNSQNFDSADFMDAMTAVGNRIKMMNFSNNSAIIDRLSGVIKQDELSMNKTGKPVTIRSVLIPKKDTVSNKVVEYYTVSASGKFIVSTMTISAGPKNYDVKQITFIMPKVDGEKDFYYKFEFNGSHPNSNKVEVHFNRNKTTKKTFQAQGYSISGEDITATPDYKFSQSEINRITNIIESIKQVENREEYKTMLEVIKDGVVRITPSV